MRLAVEHRILLADINGYMPAGSRYVPVVPERLLETRAPGQIGYEAGKPVGTFITQPRTPRKETDPFIARYVFPDGQLEAVGRIISAMNDAGFEIRHEENLREHYARTLAGWSANLDEHWEQAVDEVGIGRARVWRLYMAACRLGFERNNIQLHQVLGVKLGERGESGFPLRGWR